MRLLKEGVRKAGWDLPIYSYLGDPLGETEARIVAAASQRSSADLRVAEYSALAPVLRQLPSDGAKGVLLHDLFADRAARFRQSGRAPDFLEISREQEAEWVSEADLCVFASANELEEFAPLVPTVDCLWFPPRPPAYPIPEPNGPARVVYLGTQHAGNEDALNHFVDDIWPLVYSGSPATELWVVGSIGKSLTHDRKSHDGIRILGRVDDLREIGGMQAIGVAPTRLATGVSIKVAEYLALGMPSVAYPLAMEGFAHVLDDLVDIAEDAPEFARLVLHLLNDDEGRRERSLRAAEAGDRLSGAHVIGVLRDLGRNLLRESAGLRAVR